MDSAPFDSILDRHINNTSASLTICSEDSANFKVENWYTDAQQQNFTTDSRAFGAIDGSHSFGSRREDSYGQSPTESQGPRAMLGKVPRELVPTSSSDSLNRKIAEFAMQSEHTNTIGMRHENSVPNPSPDRLVFGARHSDITLKHDMLDASTELGSITSQPQSRYMESSRSSDIAVNVANSLKYKSQSNPQPIVIREQKILGHPLPPDTTQYDDNELKPNGHNIICRCRKCVDYGNPDPTKKKRSLYGKLKRRLTRKHDSHPVAELKQALSNCEK